MGGTAIGGDLSTWAESFPLLLANELTNNRPWLGELHLVAVYSRALGPAEVHRNYQAGADGADGVTANFSAAPPAGPAPLAVQFVDRSSGAAAYLWDFGDGITSTQASPSHTYSQPGVYTVTLTVDDGDLMDVLVRPAYIHAYSSISLTHAFAFGADTWTRATANEPGVNYVKVAQNGQNFTYSAGQGHGYVDTADLDTTPNNRGVYSGADEIYDQFIGAKNSGVIVFRLDLPAGRYRFVAAGGDAQYSDHATTIQVQDGTSDRLLTLVQDYQPAAAGQFWTVELDDKVVPPADGLGANPTFVPQADSGTLEVSQGYIRLMQRVGVGRVAGGDLSLLEVWRIDETAPAPVANFSAFPTSGTLPLTVQFFDNSTGAESYLWDFGDTFTSTQSSPSHTYTLPGVYTVTLTVAGLGPSDTLTRPGYITVTTPITAGFSAEPLAGPAPLAVTFSNSSANATEYVWAYGDGITSTITAPTHVHTYTQAGVYTVTLTATGPGGSDTLVRPAYITVTDSLIEGLAAVNDSPTILGETTTLTVTTSAGSNVSYDWAFGDGQSGSGAVVTHTYSQAGNYTAVVTASNPVSMVTATTAVTITGAAGLAISKTAPASAVAGEPVTYTLTITNSGAGPAANLLITDTLPISSYYISSGDLAGDVISWTVPALAGGAAISVTFTVTAATTITNSDYAVTADGGISAVGQEVVTTEVYPPIVPDFSAEPLSGTVPLTVTFANSTTGASTYLWAYGDGITSTTTAATHIYTYTQAGVYTVTLWAGNGAITVPLTRPAYITVTELFTRDWQVITTATTQPPVVGEHGLAYDSVRNRAILYGGNADGWPYESSTWEFDGTDWISVTTTTTPEARYGAGLAYDSARGLTVLFGGSDETDTALAQTWTYGSGTDWVEAPQVTSPPARTYPGIATNPISGTIYLFGGNDGAQAYNDLWQYDSGDWDLLPVGSEVPQARTLAALAYVSSPPPGGTEGGHLLLFGGRSVTGTILSDFWAYNFNTSAWSQIDPGGGPPGRMAHSLTYDPATGNTVLVGGVALDGETVLTDTWHYNGGWSEADPSARPPRPAYHQAAYGDNAIILVSDGEVWKYE